MNNNLASVRHPKDLIAGGVLATLFADELEKNLGIRVIRGLLSRKGQLDQNKYIIDEMIPDYSILAGNHTGLIRKLQTGFRTDTLELETKKKNLI